MSKRRAFSSDRDRALPDPPQIDDGVRQLVSTLNASRCVTTIGSCAGHAWGVRAPYVYFTCPVPVAAAIERTLRDAWASGTGLHAHWTLKGVFNEADALCFTLHAPRLNELATDPFRGWLIFGVARRRVDEDLRFLSTLLNEVLAPFRARDFPQIPASADKNAQRDESEQKRSPDFSTRGIRLAARGTAHGNSHRTVPSKVVRASRVSGFDRTYL